MTDTSVGAGDTTVPAVSWGSGSFVLHAANIAGTHQRIKTVNLMGLFYTEGVSTKRILSGGGAMLATPRFAFPRDARFLTRE